MHYQWEPYHVPTAKLEASFGAILLVMDLYSRHNSWIYIVGIMHSGKADQLTLASGGSEHA